MSIEIDALRYVGLYEEPAGSYQVDHSGTPGDFLAFPFVEGTFDFQGLRAQFNAMAGKMRKDGDQKQVLGPKSCQGTLTTVLHSHGVDCDGASDPPTKATWALLRALQTSMGGVLLDGGTSETSSSQSTVQAGSTTTTDIEVDAGHGSRFAAGGVIACQTVSGSSNLELREIASVSSDVITVKEAFSGTPITGTPVRGGVTVYMTEDPDSSLQILEEGREGSDGAWYGGLQGGFAFTLTLGELGQLSWSLAGAGWDRLGSSNATVPSYGVFNPFVLDPLEVHAPTIGSTTRVALDASEVTVESNLSYRPQRSGSAENTIARMVRAETRPLARGTFVCPYEDDTWFTARDDREDRALFIQCGDLAGGACLISFPTIQVEDVQMAPSAEGIRGQRVTWRARHDEEIGGSTEVGYSAMRLHFV